MRFESYGPFYFDRNFEGKWHEKFWSSVENEYFNLSHAIGCYAFCLRHGSSVKPWYVGKTINQNGFRAEVFASQKINHYMKILHQKAKHTPLIMLFPMVTDTWQYSQSRSIGSDAIDWLETTLIGMSLAKNPEIANTSKTQFFRNVYVNGVIGAQWPGRPSNASAFAKRVFVA